MLDADGKLDLTPRPRPCMICGAPTFNIVLFIDGHIMPDGSGCLGANARYCGCMDDRLSPEQIRIIAHQWYRQGFLATFVMLAIAASITRVLALMTMAVLQ